MIRTLIFCCSPGCVMFVDWCPVVRRAPPLTMQRLDGRLVLAEYGKTCRPGWRHGLITGCQGKTFFFCFICFFLKADLFLFFFFSWETFLDLFLDTNLFVFFPQNSISHILFGHIRKEIFFSLQKEGVGNTLVSLVSHVSREIKFSW